MVKHIILWKLCDDIPLAAHASVKHEVKTRLEALVGRVPGLRALAVQTEGLATSSADMMLDSAFTDAEALAAYQTNPLHVAAAEYVRSVVSARLCLDFEVDA